MRQLTFVSTVAVPLLLAACSAGGPQSSGLPASKKAVELTAEEYGKLCDFSADWLGGYGAKKECSEDGQKVTITAAASREICVAGAQKQSEQLKKAAQCDLTVGDLEVIARSIAKCDEEPGFEAALSRSMQCEPSAATGPSLATSTVRIPFLGESAQ